MDSTVVVVVAEIGVGVGVAEVVLELNHPSANSASEKCVMCRCHLGSIVSWSPLISIVTSKPQSRRGKRHRSQMPMNCVCCGKGLTRDERTNPDKKCHRHTKHRKDRCPPALMRTWMNNEKLPRSSGKPGALLETLLPRQLREEFPSLVQTFATIHEHGGGIWCLDARPDVRAVQDVSRFCYAMLNKGLLDETSGLCFALAANRMWDASASLDLKDLIKKRPTFDLANMRSYLKQVEAEVLSCNVRVGCPTGCAGAHSGLTWLRDLCSSREHFARFKAYVGHLTPQLRNKRGGPSGTKDMWLAISKPKKTGLKTLAPQHLGVYYKMQTYRVCKHAWCISHPRRAARPACPDSEYLWNEVLLKHKNGGAVRKSLKHGLRDWKQARRFCEGMRKVKANFCMCDLACWICLS